MEQTDKIVASILESVSVAMSNAVTEYGADTVELALLIYRMEAARSMGVTVLGLVFCALGFKLGHWLFRKAKDEGDSELSNVLFGCSIIVAVASAMVVMAVTPGLLDTFQWAAIFGYPEVYIGAKALTAAGLL